MAQEITVTIIRHIAELGERSSKGWCLELNECSWNGGKPKFDIRSWSEDHQKMGKGITLTYDELALLVEACQEKGVC